MVEGALNVFFVITATLRMSLITPHHHGRKIPSHRPGSAEKPHRMTSRRMEVEVWLPVCWTRMGFHRASHLRAGPSCAGASRRGNETAFQVKSCQKIYLHTLEWAIIFPSKKSSSRVKVPFVLSFGLLVLSTITCINTADNLLSCHAWLCPNTADTPQP